MFWNGVRHLHEYGFQVIVVCCDGAACNRSFMEMNSTTTNPGQTLNTYGNWPLFLISDPTHLIKKMRNNFSKSGFHSSCTRTLFLNGQPILWRHVRDVYDRDKCRPLHFTPLRADHVNLTSLSQMRSRLAYDIFNERVEDEMETCARSETKATREFLGRVRPLITVFSSHEKLSNPNNELAKLLYDTANWFSQWKVKPRQTLGLLYHRKCTVISK